MPNVTITQLPQANPLTGTESVPIVQDGQTRQTTTGAIANAPVLNQEFLTVVQEPTLPNSRYVSTTTGIGIQDGGAQSFFRLTLNGASGSLEVANTGIVAKTNSNTVEARTLTVGTSGLSIADGNGVSGNPTFSLTGTVLSLANLATTGMLSIAGGSVNARVIYGTTNQINVANGNGAADPVISIADNAVFPGAGAIKVPVGTTAQRPAGVDGLIRYNTDLNTFEVYEDGSWSSLPSGGVTLINTGTGLTGGPITSTGTISIANTGVTAAAYGSASSVATFTVNAQGQLTNAASVPIAINGNQVTSGTVGVAFGGTNIASYSNGDLLYASGATTLSKLAIGTNGQVLTSSGTGPQWSNASSVSVTSFSGDTTGLTPATPTTGAVTLGGVLVGANGGTGVNNSGKTITLGGDLTLAGAFSLTLTQVSNTNVSLPTSGTLATVAGAEVFSNKTISGATNTLTNIPNVSLDNSAVTFNGVTVSLGGSGSITATTTNALTVGSGLQLNSGTSFDGSSAKTISIDSTVVTETGIQTLSNKTLTTPTIAQILNVGTLTLPNTSDTLVGRDTIDTLANKSMSGSSNTFTNIPNNALSNSSVTYNGVNVALGGSATITANTTNAVTFNDSGLGDTSGTTFDGSSAKTISYNTVGASPLAGSSSLVTVGTVTSGTWNATPIANNYLANSDITLGTTSVSLGGSSATIAGLTSVTVTQPPSSALQLATKQYVDDAVSTGIDIHPPVRVRTPSALTATYTSGGTAVTVTDITGSKTLTFSSSPSLSINDQIVFTSTSNGIVAGTAYYVYSAPAANQVTLSLSYNGPELTTLTNGTGLTISGTVNAGVGATLTNAGTKAAIQIDGINLSSGNSVLVLSQANAYENGVYTVTTVGTPDPGGTNWVLTRRSTEDKYQPDSITGMGQGDYFFVQEGSTGAGNSYVMTTNNPLIIGTTNLTFTQFSASQVYSAGTGITLSGTQISITNTGVSANTYGSASAVPVIAVNAQGQITSASDSAISINGNQITSGTVGSSYLSGSYTGITGVGTLTAGTWNASTITAGYGGTGIASYTTGDLLYAGSATTINKLGIGSTNAILTSTGSAPQWTAPSSIAVGTATNLAGGTAGALAYQTNTATTSFVSLGTQNYVLIAGATAPQYVAQSTLSVGTATNADNTAITSNSTNADYYLTVVSNNTGNLPQLVATGLTANPSTGKITGGIAGGTF
jgi:hypothetical protein